MSDLSSKFWAAPPVTRTLVAATFIQSVAVFMQVLPFTYILFQVRLIFKIPPEPWRLLTSFCMTGGGLQFVFDLYFMWTYGTGLELNSRRFTKPGDFFVYVCFCAVVILSLAGFLLGGYIFTGALILAFIYTFAQDNRGRKAHFVILQIPVELLPWATLLLTLLFGGPDAALQQGTGIIAAHAYDFLTRLYPTFQGGRNYVQTPNFVRRYFGGEQNRFTHKAYGTSYRPGQAPQQGRTQSWTSGFSNTWGGRGAGRRLGGD